MFLDKKDNIQAKQTEHGNYEYTYDELYRLINTDNPDFNDESYSYDNVGNRLTSADTTGSWSYNDNNELGGYGDVSYEYDSNGNMVKKTVGGVVTSYVYNIEDRLTEVWSGDAGTGSLIAEYYYDPFGRRLWKDVSGVRTCFHYADEGLIGEFDSSGTELKSYGYKPGSTWTTDPLYMKVGSDYYFYQNDHLGTPQKLTSVSGAVVWSAKYNSFGEASIDGSSSVVNNLRFPGQYEDGESGLHYNLNRYYDPTVGRYSRVDPIGLKGGMNLFVYVDNNSINAFDPFGLQSQYRNPGSNTWGRDWRPPRSPNFQEPNPYHVPTDRVGRPGANRAPGGSSPPPGSNNRSVIIRSMAELRSYVLGISIDARVEFEAQVEAFTGPIEYTINCQDTETRKLCFMVYRTYVEVRFVRRPGGENMATTGVQCVSIELTGRRGCCIE